MTRRVSRAIVAVAMAGAAIITMVSPASAAIFSCSVAGLLQLEGDIPMTGTGPAAVTVGESNAFGLDVNLANVIPEEFSFLEGTASSAVVSIKVPPGVEIDASSATVTGVDGASFAIAGDTMTVTLPGPIAFGGETRLPLVSASFSMKATQAGTITMTTEGASAVVEAEVAIAPGTAPIQATVPCDAGAPETILTVTASDVASATQTPAPTAAATQPAAGSTTAGSTTAATTTAATTTATAADPSLATTGAHSTTMTGVALLMLGFGMLAVAGQRVMVTRRP